VKIYTTYCRKATDTANARKYGVGFMLTPSHLPSKKEDGIFYAIDNGAFTLATRGYPFLEGPFLKLLEKSRAVGIRPDFIAIPDIIGGGRDSLDLSMMWINRMAGCPCLALVVQDGMTPWMVEHVLKRDLERVAWIFIGGSVGWKWQTAAQWREFATKHGKMLHIGQAGKVDTIAAARRIGADSCDSSSFARNNSWKILERADAQQRLQLEGQAK